MFGFGSRKCRLGGTLPCLTISTDLMNPATPAAESRCPMFDFSEPIAHRCPPLAPSARKASASAVISIGSPSGVAAPCVST